VYQFVFFKNKKEDQLAIKIPLGGIFDDPKTNIITIIYELLKNGFILPSFPLSIMK